MNNKIEQTNIETDRLILRPFTSSDIDDVFSYASDPKMTRFVTWEAHKTKEDSRTFLEWIASATSHDKDKLFFIYAVVLKGTNGVIGTIDFKNKNKFCAQVDYSIGKKYWNNGYVSEGVKAIVEWSYNSLPEITRYQAFCQPENIGSRKVMEKVGMEYEGLLRKYFVIKGIPVDVVHYALIR